MTLAAGLGMRVDCYYMMVRPGVDLRVGRFVTVTGEDI